ncbi:MAG: ABC transporter ATP-binding protein [bacterium]|nr:ABC transporter ATP-binding protein [bacterium]
MVKIEFKNITKNYKQKNGILTILRNLSFSLEGNGFYCFFGPSGYGKTTILNLISELVLPSEGEVILRLNNKNGKDHKPRISYVFQDDRLLPWKTVFENINFLIKNQYPNKHERENIINKYLKLVNLHSSYNNYPDSLSGGEKQRVSIARALSIDPDLILMDEPFSHLDEMVAAKLRSDLLRICEKSSKTILFITHNFLEAIYLADKIFVLAAKPIMELKEIVVDIPRPRSSQFYEEFIFQKKTQELIKKIKNISSCF